MMYFVILYSIAKDIRLHQATHQEVNQHGYPQAMISPEGHEEIGAGKEQQCRNERRLEHAPCLGDANENAIPNEGQHTCYGNQPSPSHIFAGGFNHHDFVGQYMQER